MCWNSNSNSKSKTQMVTKLQNSIVTKIKNSNGVKTQKLKLGQNSNCNKTQKLYLWQKDLDNEGDVLWAAFCDPCDVFSFFIRSKQNCAKNPKLLFMAKFGYRVIAIQILVLYLDKNTVLRQFFLQQSNLVAVLLKYLRQNSRRIWFWNHCDKNTIEHTLPKKCNQKTISNKKVKEKKKCQRDKI